MIDETITHVLSFHSLIRPFLSIPKIGALAVLTRLRNSLAADATALSCLAVN